MTTPITLTDSAIAHIKTMMLKKSGALGFRLGIKKTGCSGYAYLPDIISEINPNDLHFVAQNDLPVYISQDALNFVVGLVVDFVEDETLGLKQKKLIFINPNEKNRCGCGESFTVE